MRKLLAGLLVVLLLSIGLSGIGFAEEERVLNMYFSAAENWGALLAEKFPCSVIQDGCGVLNK